MLAAFTALRLAHHHSPALGGHYRQALTTLSLALPERVRHTLNASLRGGGGTMFTDRQMEIIGAAWLDGRVLRFDHREGNGILRTGLDLCVHFVEIARTNLAPFVIGLNRASGRMETFKLSRMTNLHLLTECYEPDPTFDPQAYLSDAWGVIGPGEGVTVTVRFDPDAAYRVLEGGFPQATLIRGDGFVDIEFCAGWTRRACPANSCRSCCPGGPRRGPVAARGARRVARGDARRAVPFRSPGAGRRLTAEVQWR